MMIMIYFVVSLLSFSLITWVMIRSINRSNFPPNNDDDGGLPPENDFPIIDLPPGGRVEDILVDRWHGDIVSSKTTRPY